MLARDPAAGKDPLLMALAARSEIGLGNAERGCEIGKSLLAVRSALPKPIQADALLINGYCALVRGDTDGAGLQASLLRDLELSTSAGADLLDAAAAGVAPDIPSGAKLSPLDYRIGAIKGGFQRDRLIAAASPALLAALGARSAHASGRSARSGRGGSSTSYSRAPRVCCRSTALRAPGVTRALPGAQSFSIRQSTSARRSRRRASSARFSTMRDVPASTGPRSS